MGLENKNCIPLISVCSQMKDYIMSGGTRGHAKKGPVYSD